MKPRAISPANRIKATVDDMDDARDAVTDFLSDMRHAAGREDAVFDAWAQQQFYARFYQQLQKPGTFTDAVDRVLTEDLPELCRELEEEAEAEAREEAAHERYCRAMVGRGKGW